ncbi:MAG: acyl-CoA desaturase [Candidatus Omnitrophica bacterium]|nr:acyl-CoA desaturase [Candidatus Omnitrophota bacterium]
MTKLEHRSLNPDEKIHFKGNIPFFSLHLGCLLVFYTGWSKTALVIFFLSLIPRMFGLTAGYHRYFSHRSYKTSRFFQFILAFLGACSLQKDCLWWAAHHRLHHRNTDTEIDAHSPRHRGFIMAHVGWFMCKKNYDFDPMPHIPDLAKYPELVFLHKHPKLPALFWLLLLAASGFYLEHAHPELGTTMGQAIVWGFFISTVFLHHVTFCVNSVTHMSGTRRFNTPDDSRNNLWVALCTMGEGWHNNHHRYQSSERQGFYWWEIDMTHLILVFLSWFGIVWQLRSPPKEIYEEAERNRQAKWVHA